MNIFDFIDKSVERRNRIKLAMAAYAYEFENNPIMSDSEFDALCLQINPSESTVESWHDHATRHRYEILDRFWGREFDASTGLWIHRHPELALVKQTYEKFYK